MTNINLDKFLKNNTTFNFGNFRHKVEANTKFLPLNEPTGVLPVIMHIRYFSNGETLYRRRIV